MIKTWTPDEGVAGHRIVAAHRVTGDYELMLLVTYQSATFTSAPFTKPTMLTAS